MNPSSHHRPVEPLEGRRLFANYVIDVDGGASRVDVSATLDGESLERTDRGNGRLDGSQAVSVTRRGVAFDDNGSTGTAIGSGTGSVNATGIVVTDADGRTLDFEFESADGQQVSVSGASFGFDGGRAKIKNNRFSTRAITATLNDGALGVSGSALGTQIEGFGGDVRASNGRIARSSGSSQVVVPFSFTISTTVSRPGFSSADVEVTFSGKLVGTIRDSSVFGTTPGVSFPQSVTTRDRVATDVLG